MVDAGYIYIICMYICLQLYIYVYECVSVHLLQRIDYATAVLSTNIVAQYS